MKKSAQKNNHVIPAKAGIHDNMSGFRVKHGMTEFGFSALAVLTVLGLFLAISLALVGTGTIKLPGGANLAVSPIPVSDPVEDDEACNDPYNADCEDELENDPEDLTPAQIQKALEED
jgi:hypothetical protein